jgi:hypothetical protein
MNLWRTDDEQLSGNACNKPSRSRFYSLPFTFFKDAHEETYIIKEGVAAAGLAAEAQRKDGPYVASDKQFIKPEEYVGKEVGDPGCKVKRCVFAEQNPKKYSSPRPPS